MRYKQAKIPNFCVKVFFVILISSTSSICFSGSVETYITKAQKFQAEGDYVDAIAEFYKAIIKEPSYPYTYSYLAVISDVVLSDYDSAIMFYEKALSLLKFRKAFLDKGLLSTNPADGNTSKNGDLFSADKLDAAIKDIEDKKEKLIKKKFEAIDNPIYPTYIVLKPKKKVYAEPGTSGKAIPPTTQAGQSEFMFLELQDNWCKVQLPSSSEGWIKGKDINLIYRNKAKPIMLSKSEKAEIYEEFSINFQNNVLAEKAKAISDKLYHEVGGKSHAVKEMQPEKIVKKEATVSVENQGTAGKEQQIMEKLKKLDDFYKKGLIDKEEYEEKRKEVLKEL